MSIVLTDEERTVAVTALTDWSSVTTATLSADGTILCSGPMDFGVDFVATLPSGEIFPIDPPLQGLQCPRLEDSVQNLEFQIDQRIRSTG